MATITGLTAERMLEIEGQSVVDGEIISGNLILTKHDGTTIDAGPVAGPQGPMGPMGPAGFIPAEVKLWPGGVLPDPAKYGKWVWADGAVYAVSTYPLAAANIASQWRTFGGASDPGGSNFRVPDLRGLAPVGMDAMPGGARANRMTRSVAITIAARTGEETHVVSIDEMPAHAHNIYDPGHSHGVNDPGHTHATQNSTENTQPFDYPGWPTYGPYNQSRSWPPPLSTSATGIWLSNSGTGIGIYNNGSGGAHENVQPTVFVPYIVCLNG